LISTSPIQEGQFVKYRVKVRSRAWQRFSYLVDNRVYLAKSGFATVPRRKADHLANPVGLFSLEGL